MNGTTRPVVLSLALLVLASGCATRRPPSSPTASPPPPTTASAPARPASPPPAPPSAIGVLVVPPPRTGAVPVPAPATDPARARLDEGRALIARGEMAAAAVALREALRLRPDLADARASLGLALYAKGDLVGAADAYRRVLAREPSAHDARYNLALVLKLARRDAEATPEFLAAAEAGLPRAQYFAGAAFATGAGVERDLVAAITWWTRAAEQGVAQADESLVQLRQAVSGRSRRTPAERQAVEQAFGEYRARLWKDYPGLAREGDEPLGAALLRQGRAGEAIVVLIREAAALSEPAQRILETLYDQGIDGQLLAHDARILAYLKSAAAEGRSRPRP